MTLQLTTFNPPTTLITKDKKMEKNNQNSFENTPEGVEIYETLYFNLPTIDKGGSVSEEHIWKCVNELLDKYGAKLEEKKF